MKTGQYGPEKNGGTILCGNLRCLVPQRLSEKMNCGDERSIRSLVRPTATE